MELDRLAKNKVASILISRNGAFSIGGNPKKKSDITVEIADGVKCELTVENIRLLNSKKLPCIEIGKECDVTLVILGENVLSMGGIRVPESSTFTLKGEGNLTIELDNDDYFGIGEGVDKYHGSIILEQSGCLKVEANGNMGICIGSGYGGDISLRKGQYALEMNGDRALGIGVLYNDSTIDIDSCDLNIELNTLKGTAIGSDSANDNITISNSSVKLYLSGKEAVGIGTITGETSDVYIHDASAVVNVHNDRCSATAALDGTTGFKLERASLRIYAKGESVLPFGGFTGDTDVTLVDSDTTVKINTDLDLKDYISPERVNIEHGRARIVLNGYEYELAD